MKKLLAITFVICHLTFVICASAQAMVFEDTTTQTKMYLVPNSGSHIGLTDGTVKIRDIKGYPFGGPFTASDGTRIEPGFGSFTGTSGAVVATTGLTEGPVILNISRVADTPGSDISDIKVTWQINPLFYGPTINANTAVDIYFMTGKGSGEYSPGSFSDMVIQSNQLNPYLTSDVTLDIANKYFIFKNQVGAGYPEIYFKGLITGSNPQATDPTGLGGAVAVGKINITLQGQAQNAGKNLIACPFYLEDASVKNVFGDGTDSPWQIGDMIQKKTGPSPAYLTATYTKENEWRDAASAKDQPKFNIDQTAGNWAIVNGERKISLVGKVFNSALVVPIFGGAGETTGGKTLLGLVYPVQIGLGSTTLITDGAAQGDMIQYKISPLDEAYISATVKDGLWINAAKADAAIDPRINMLKTPNSYIFVRYGQTAFDWKRTAP